MALVTGGTRGIGAAVVKLFAEEGAIAVFCGRNVAEGGALERELVAAGGRVAFMEADVTDEASVRDLIAEIVRRFGHLDIVVNNAGITLAATTEDTTLDGWRSIMDANLASVFLVSKHAIPELRRSARPAIVNLGSTYGVIGAAGNAAYATSKAAVIGFTKTLALELAPDRIRVNAVCPGATATPMNVEWLAAQPDPDAALQELVDAHPIGRMARPEEPAAAILFLASDEASYITGHALLVDGGRTIE